MTDPGAGAGVAPYLSVVIPVHDEERRLPPCVERLEAVLDRLDHPSEILVVENGSSDRTLEIARELEAASPRLRALRVDRRGKGLACRAGMLAGRGEYRFLCDVDLSMPPEQILRFLPPALQEFDVAIGSRELPDSDVVDSASRHWIGRTFNALVRGLAVRGIRDTQCGFKCFRGEVAKSLFSRQSVAGMCFDVELLFLAQRDGLRIVEVPIRWVADAETRVRMVRDSLEMARDVLRIRWNAARGAYGPPRRPSR